MGCSHLHTAFIEFQQVYDNIDRTHHLDHLNNTRMPTHLINVIRQMYNGDEYVLIDGAKTTSTSNSAVPSRGVKQGYPLSPLLFSLFINDAMVEFGFMGAVTGTEVLRVTHMLYADDLTLTAIDPIQLQKMLRRLESYAARKGLTVNVQKSNIVIFMLTEIPQFLFFVSTIRSLKRENLLPTWECYLISTWTYTMLRPMLWGLLMQLYVEWKSLVLKRGFLTGLMRCCGFSRH